jgi:hypothetical protein
VTLVKSPYFHRPDPTDESYRNRPTKIAYLLSVFSEADKRYEANGRSQVYCSVLGHHSNDETAATNRLPIAIEASREAYYSSGCCRKLGEFDIKLTAYTYFLLNVPSSARRQYVY